MTEHEHDDEAVARRGTTGSAVAVRTAGAEPGGLETRVAALEALVHELQMNRYGIRAYVLANTLGLRTRLCLALGIDPRPAADAVDPHAADPGTPAPREKVSPYADD